MGFVCGPDGSCRARTAQDASSSPTGGALDAGFCTNQRAQECKIGYTPFDSAELACGFGQVCELATDGRALCKCAMGTCGTDGNCAVNPFDPFNQAAPAPPPVAPAAGQPLTGSESPVQGAAAAPVALDASFCTNQRAQTCKIGYTPFDSPELACGFGQMCQTAADGRTLCQCSYGMGNCQEDGSCQGFNPFGQGASTPAAAPAPLAAAPVAATPEAVPEAATAGATTAATTTPNSAGEAEKAPRAAQTEGAPLDAAFCTNQRTQACKIGFAPFTDSPDLACGFGQTCQRATDGRSLCKCNTGTCSSDGISCAAGLEESSQTETTNAAPTTSTSQAAEPKVESAATDTGSLDASFCTNQRAQACKISFMPLVDSAELACGLGQTCEQAPNGQSLCQCAVGTCSSDGGCEALHPFEANETVGQAPEASTNGTAVGGAAVAAGAATDTGSLDASFCTNQRAQACKISFMPLVDSAELACGLGQTCEQAPNGQSLCQCAVGTCSSDGGCEALHPFEANETVGQAPEASTNGTAVGGAAGAATDTGSLDASFCTNQRAQACKVSFIPFVDSAELACGLGQTCELTQDGRALCHCIAGTCGSDGSCGGLNPFETNKTSDQATEASANGTAVGGAATGSLDASFCTNQRAQACKLSFVPFVDSAELACGLGQTCQKAPDGQSLCQCAVGTCSSDGSCGGLNPFETNKTSDQAPDASAGETAVGGAATGSLDASFCTNQRAQACKLSFVPFVDSAELACGLGQTCQKAPDGQSLCQCAVGTCSSDGSCGGLNPFETNKTSDQAPDASAGETAVGGAATGSLDASFCTNQRAQACKLSFVPFVDSAELACGLGQTCQKAPDGQSLCQCAVGTCSSDGSCGGLNPFETSTTAEQAPEASATGTAGATNALDAAFCTNTRTVACKIGYSLLDSPDTACSFGQICAEANDGRPLCKCAVGSCNEDGACGA